MIEASHIVAQLHGILFLALFCELGLKIILTQVSLSPEQSTLQLICSLSQMLYFVSFLKIRQFWQF
jgi:hypothetical protein